MVDAEMQVQVARVQAMLHKASVEANWRVFHVGVPAEFANYVYRYLDGVGVLLYVGMTSSAARRADAHWRKSDWRSWVQAVEYTRCHNRDEAFKLESKIRREERPLFAKTHRNAAVLAEMDRAHPINHVTGTCHCNLPELTKEILANTVVEYYQQDPSGWT
jgi:predicted GIY-YIG superfamily endonuclease